MNSNGSASYFPAVEDEVEVLTSNLLWIRIK